MRLQALFRCAIEACILALILMVCIFASKMRPNQTNYLKGAVLITVIWRLYAIVIDGIKNEFSDLDHLREYVNSRLYSARYGGNKHAARCNVYTYLSANRFGVPPIPAA